MSEFKKGDIVILKSGGPTMTVKEVKSTHDEVTVTAQWFAGKKLEFGRFTPESLALAPEEN